GAGAVRGPSAGPVRRPRPTWPRRSPTAWASIRAWSCATGSIARCPCATASRSAPSCEEHAMPLRDHFHPPLSLLRQWTSFHAARATYLSAHLNRLLPPRHLAQPLYAFV